MQKEAGPEWDHIDQLTLEEVEKSWAHSRCREVEFDICGTAQVCVCVCVCACVRACVCVCATSHNTLFFG